MRKRQATNREWTQKRLAVARQRYPDRHWFHMSGSRLGYYLMHDNSLVVGMVTMNDAYKINFLEGCIYGSKPLPPIQVSVNTASDDNFILWLEGYGFSRILTVKYDKSRTCKITLV